MIDLTNATLSRIEHNPILDLYNKRIHKLNKEIEELTSVVKFYENERKIADEKASAHRTACIEKAHKLYKYRDKVKTIVERNAKIPMVAKRPILLPEKISREKVHLPVGII